MSVASQYCALITNRMNTIWQPRDPSHPGKHPTSLALNDGDKYICFVSSTVFSVFYFLLYKS